MPKNPAIERLKKMRLDDDRNRFPNFPEHARVIPSYTDKNEKGLIKCIVDFLNLSGHQAERIDNKGTRVDERKVVTNVIGQMKVIGSVRWNYSQNTPGTADVSATIAGKSVKIEIKIGSDTQKPKQKLYQEKIERAGGIYFIAKDFQGFLAVYENIVAGTYTQGKLF